MKVVTPEKMAELDHKEIKERTPSLELMERAGTAAANKILDYIQRLPVETTVFQILIASGFGNNGGDGLVIARKLAKHGQRVSVLFSGKESERDQLSSKDSKENYSKLPDSVKVFYAGDMKAQAVKSLIDEQSLIVDALYGTGFKTDRTMAALDKEIIRDINQSKACVVAIDIPSGLNGKTGQKAEEAVSADLTIPIQLIKSGELLTDGPDLSGILSVAPIGINTDDPDIFMEYQGDEPFEGFPKPRKKNSYKYTYGSAVIIAGSKGMLGSCALAANACIHSGAGLVRVCVENENYPQESLMLPKEALVTTYHYVLTDEVLSPIRKDAILFGPGIGRHMDYSGLITYLLKQDTPVVIDADGLWHLKNSLDLLKKSKTPVILTPHMGEFMNLSGMSKETLLADPVKCVRDFSVDYGVSVVFKGYRTIVATPDGKVWFNSTGNPGMATAGSGDVLSGMITSILAQTGDTVLSAKAGVYYHGKAGDYYAQEFGPTTLVAEDITKCLKYVLK